MTNWQITIIVFYGLLNIYLLSHALSEIKHKKNIFGLSPKWNWLGIFVWGDVIIISPFWLLIAVTTLLMQDWYLFLLASALFWVVRSAGEVIYWLNEQFAGSKRNPPHTLKYFSFIQSEAIWFIYQLFWQCLLVLSLLASIYLTPLWLQTKLWLLQSTIKNFKLIS